ncbi:MAG: glycogen debranching N-terminal domain-containing protein [Rhodospirillaceae bacterium]
MNTEIRIFQPRIVLHGSEVALVCDVDGQVHAEGAYGLFAGDTRVLSTYKYQLNGNAWTLLGHARTGHGSAQWHFQNAAMRDDHGLLDAGTIAFTLNRRVDGALHDDFEVHAFAQRQVRVRFILQLDADFADLFEVKSGSISARLRTLKIDNDEKMTLTYERSGFQRGLIMRIRCDRCTRTVTGSRVTFSLSLQHAECWRCCIDATPEVQHRELRLKSNAHAPEPEPRTDDSADLRLTSDALLQEPFDCARSDLHALAIHRERPLPFLAAGVPWFLALFGRDSLLPSLMAGLDGPWSAEGALAALSVYQTDEDDAFRDAQPGKFPHELREDELTYRGELPYSPYFGTHDVPSLYCLALWNAWRWTGDAELVSRHLAAAKRGLAWCGRYGDRDGDGLQEYATRSRKGYRNQGWKDAGDAIVDSAGCQPEVPMATVELQGYLYAAHLALADLLHATEQDDEAEEQRGKARALRELVEARYWLEDQQYYALALDKEKHSVDAIASNAAHLLWCGLAAKERAEAVGRRLVAAELFSGWGLRTLSSDNPAYNPLSYQRGSVWPFDTMLAAAGLIRYGQYDRAFELMQSVLEAARRFEHSRLPELFGGFNRAHGVPVPYQEANIPQAWSSAVPLLAVQLLMGLVPDAPRGICHINPRLPRWLSTLSLSGIRVGRGSIDIVLRRKNGETVVDDMRADGVEVRRGVPKAVLWGAPMVQA